MRSPAAFFRFLLKVQGAVVTDATWSSNPRVVQIAVRRRSNAAARCSACGAKLGGALIEKTRKWRHLDLFRTRCELVGTVREGRCPVHGRVQEGVGWAAHRAAHTHEFDREVAYLAQVADRTAVARVYGLHWRTVGRIIARVVAARLPSDRFEGLVGIGVDEVAHKRGHRYLTIVTCLCSGRVVWTGEGRSAEVLGRFFEELGPERAAKLEVVALDMCEAYAKAVREAAPQADLVFDRFHVVQLLMKAVDEVRREEVRKMPQGEARSSLKGARFALLRNPRHADDETRTKDAAKIAAVKASNDRLYQAYELRVAFETVWSQSTEAAAGRALDNWAAEVLGTTLQPLRRFARTIQSHREGILGYFRHHGVSNAIAEGVNNKVRLVIHRAFGFRNPSHLAAMIHLCCSKIDLSEVA